MIKGCRLGVGSSKLEAEVLWSEAVVDMTVTGCSLQPCLTGQYSDGKWHDILLAHLLCFHIDSCSNCSMSLLLLGLKVQYSSPSEQILQSFNGTGALTNVLIDFGEVLSNYAVVHMHIGNSSSSSLRSHKLACIQHVH